MYNIMLTTFSSCGKFTKGLKKMVDWESVGTGITGTVTAIAIDTNGDLYVGGTIAAFNGIAKFNKTTSLFETVGTGFSSVTSITCITVGPDGNIYVGGNVYLTTNPTASVSFAVYNTVAGTWSTIGTEFGHLVRSIVFDTNNNMYVGGYFPWLKINGTTLTNSGRIVKYNLTTSTWSALGTGITGPNNDVGPIGIDTNGNVYVAGADYLTQAGSVNLNYSGRWTPSTSTWSALGSGIGTNVVEIVVLSDDEIHYANYGTNKFNKWTPSTSTWTALPNPSGSQNMTSLGKDSGNLYAGLTNGQVAKWNGSVWSTVGTTPSNLTAKIKVYNQSLIYKIAYNASTQISYLYKYDLQA